MSYEPGPMEFILGTDDLARSARFYDPVMAVLGLGRLPDPPKNWLGWGPGKGGGLWLCLPYDGQPAGQGNGTMVSFRAETAVQVRAFHAKALTHGGTDEGPPGTRPHYSPEFYVAYVRDPNGHKLACAFWNHDPTKDTE